MTAALGKTGVIYGGRSAEREVSLMSGRGVQEALTSQGVDAHLFDIGERSLAELAAQGYERVFIALHGRYGEDGTIQGALELLGLPYTGSGTMASSLAMDKIMTKKVWLYHDLPTPEHVELTSEAELDSVVERLGLPLIIKPPHEGSTLGLTKVEQLADLAPALELALRYDSIALGERFIQGRELTVPLLGKGEDARALPVIEILAPDGNYDYEHKYHSDSTEYLCPAPLSPSTAQRVQELARQAYVALGCEGWGRADIMLDSQEQPWLLEMNTSPGMTSHSLVPMSAAALGMSYAELCVEILRTASCKVITGSAEG